MIDLSGRVPMTPNIDYTSILGALTPDAVAAMTVVVTTMSV